MRPCSKTCRISVRAESPRALLTPSSCAAVIGLALIYAGQSTPVRTIVIDNLLLCRADLDENLVYRLTKGLLDAMPYAAPRLGRFLPLDLRRAPATPLPLHMGAARYYRDRELFQ